MDDSTTNSRDSASTSNAATRSFPWKHDARDAGADADRRAAESDDDSTELDHHAANDNDRPADANHD